MKRLLTTVIHAAGCIAFRHPARRPPSTETTRRILVVNFHYLGDVFFSTPAIASLKRRFPGATIDAVVKSRGRAALEGNPDIGKIIVFDSLCNDRTREGRTDWRALRDLSRKLKGYDLWVDFTGVPASCAFAALARPPWSVGFSKSGFGFVFDQEIWPAPDLPFVEKYNALVARLGATPDSRPVFAASAESFPPPPDLLLHVGGGFPLKLWGVEKFEAVAQRFRGQGLSVATVGGPDDPAEINNLSVRQVAAMARHCRVYVGHDTGLTHIVASLGVPTVAIYGPTNPRFSRLPWPNLHVVQIRLECSPAPDARQCEACRPMVCSHHSCMRTLDVETVVQEIQKCLDESFISSRN